MSTSVLEMPSLPKRSSIDIRPLPTVVPQPTPGTEFTEEEINAFHRDDAMTAGMIAVILGIAFSVLLVLVGGVTTWMLMSAG